MRTAAIAALMLAAAVSAGAYVHEYNSAFVAVSRRDYTGIQFHLSPSVQPGLMNSAGQLVIVPGSDPRAAIQAALDTWSAVPGTSARFLPLKVDNVPVGSGDGIDAFSFDDTPAARSVLGDAVAVTTITSYLDGKIVDTDILFNPAYTFASELSPGAFDLQQIATHELGHALGTGHYGLPTCVMYPASAPGDLSRRALSADDVAFVTGAYPAPGVMARLGSISGSLLSSTGPVPQAEVIAIDPTTGVAVGSLSNRDGGFQL